MARFSVIHLHGLGIAFIFSLILSTDTTAQDQAMGLEFPAGFEVVEYSGSDLANDIFCLTTDPKGRIVVSGRGYIKILVDKSGDGFADRAINFADGPADGAMGLLWEGDSLFVTGGGGLLRYRDTNGDDRADGPPERIAEFKTGGEHHAHAIRRGPDGWLYLIVGNTTGIDQNFATSPTSPIKDPEAGCVLRFSPDFQHSEIVAEGFRNPYDFDFDPEGELFAFDSDNERCVSLPWYEFTRFYHVRPGGHHGWLVPQLGEFWRYPPEFEDVVEPVATLGRGSPTGVVCYQHESFPERYQGGFFLLDWTFGQVFHVPMERRGATYQGEPELFLRSIGDEGFAPTDVVVHPESGDLYISIGGRGTRGAVYRVRYVGEAEEKNEAPTRQSRTALQVPPGVIDQAKALELDLPEVAKQPDALDRLRALTALRRHQDAFEVEAIKASILVNWDHADRPIRQAVADLIANLDATAIETIAEQAQAPWQRLTLGFGLAQIDPDQALQLARQVLEAVEATAEQQQTAARLIQVASGGLVHPKARGTVWEGYSARLDSPPLKNHATLVEALKAVRAVFPSDDVVLDRELSRTLAACQDDDPGTLEAVMRQFGESSDPILEIHYLIVLGRLQGPRSLEVTKRTADALLAIDRKLDAIAANRDRNWPLRISELYAELAEKDQRLHAELLQHPEFSRPDHSLYARSPGFDRQGAAFRFLDQAKANPDFSWNPDLVAIVGELEDDQAAQTLRNLWGKAGLDDQVLPILAKNPKAEDLDKFLQGIRSSRQATVRASFSAIETLGLKGSEEELLALVLGLRRLPDAKESEPLRERIVQLLQTATSQNNLGNSPGPWVDWFLANYPEHAARLLGGESVDMEAWFQRLAKIDWSAGDSDRGFQVFTKTQCAACHSGNQAIGPDLRGVTNRFSIEDLFQSILQPNRDVAERYRTQLIATADGNIYEGIIIYEAVDGLLLQTGPAETIRIAGPAIEERRESDVSLMPAGLIDDLSDLEIADLYEYLKQMR